MLNKLVLASVCIVLTQGALATPMTVQTVISDIQVTEANGGINPDAFAYKITAKVLVGANSCEAKNVKASLVKKVADGVISVVPMKRLPRGAPSMCTREWKPIYKTISLTVRGLQSQVEDVVVLNINEYGASTSISALLGSDAELSMSGLLDRVAAIGGESTGYALILPTGESVELDLITNNLDLRTFELEGGPVNVRGIYKTVLGIEIPSRQVLEVTSLEAAGG